MNKKRFDESKISQPHKFLLEESSFGHGNFTVIISKNYFDKKPLKMLTKKAPRKTKIKKRDSLFSRNTFGTTRSSKPHQK